MSNIIFRKKSWKTNLEEMALVKNKLTLCTESACFYLIEKLIDEIKIDIDKL